MKRTLLTILSLIIIFSCSNNKKENEETNTNKEIENKEEKNNDNIEKSEYELMKESSELVGKWIMEFTVGKQEKVLIEFYNKDGEYFEVWSGVNPTIRKLVKEKNKYLRQKKGEYYIIKESGDLTVYDEEGYVGEEYGFRYITIN